MMLLWPLIALGLVFRVVTTLKVRRRASSACGRWRLLLAAIAALVVGLLSAGTASATTLPNLGTRVGASPARFRSNSRDTSPSGASLSLDPPMGLGGVSVA